jgi:hypothetical protein
VTAPRSQFPLELQGRGESRSYTRAVGLHSPRRRREDVGQGAEQDPQKQQDISRFNSFGPSWGAVMRSRDADTMILSLSARGSGG